MYNSIILLIAVLLSGLYSTSVYSQQKYEKESRLNHKDVPSTALDFINAVEITNKIKWYAEDGLESKSIEAKFKLNKKRHSVEFDTTGIIQDVEIEINRQELQPQLRDSIHSQLCRICSRYNISKIQVQYSGSQSILLSLLKGEEPIENFTTKYEIITKCVAERKTELFEYLFSDEGKILKTSKIIFKNSSNLEY